MLLYVVALLRVERSALRRAQILTDPRLRDNPIVLVSDAFEFVTGYTRTSVIGRNLRFMQGPGTSIEAVERVQTAIKRGAACCELLLNYRIDGSSVSLLSRGAANGGDDTLTDLSSISSPRFRSTIHVRLAE